MARPGSPARRAGPAPPCRCASVLSASSTAAVSLFTTVAASAPVRSIRRSAIVSSRGPRSPWARSYSRLSGWRGRADHGVDGGLGQRCPSEMGVDQQSRGVHDALQPDAAGRRQPRLEPGQDGVGFQRFRVDGVALGEGPAQVVENVAAAGDDILAVELDEEPFRRRVGEQPVHRVAAGETNREAWLRSLPQPDSRRQNLDRGAAQMDPWRCSGGPMPLSRFRYSCFSLIAPRHLDNGPTFADNRSSSRRSASNIEPKTDRPGFRLVVDTRVQIA